MEYKLCLVPKNLELEKKLKDINPDLINYLHKFYDFIDVLYIQSGTSNKNKTTRGKVRNKFFFERSSPYLRHRYGSYYEQEERIWMGQKIVETLLTLKMIEQQNYQVKVRSYSYRLTNKYFNQDFVRMPIKNKTFLKKLKLLDQFSSVAQLCPTLCDPMDCSM